MLVSTQTHVLFDTFGAERGLQILAESGFDCADYSMFHFIGDQEPLFQGMNEEQHAATLLRFAKACGIRFNQAHAPFPSYRPGKAEYNERAFERICASIRVAGMLGAQRIIVHPFSLEDASVQKQQNLAFFNSLQPLCEEYNIKVALENMFGYDARRRVKIVNVCSTGAELAEYVDALDPRYFTACLDVGHCGLVGDDAPRAIRELGSERLTCLHVHDNNYIEDLHTLPFLMELDWPAITAALKEIGYAGELTLEADDFLKRMPKAALPSAARLMCDVARVLAEQAS